MKKKLLIVMLMVATLMASPLGYQLIPLQAEASTLQEAPPEDYRVSPPVQANSSYDWPMLAANPQRTSWSPEEVRGNLNVEWYRPIEPYIPYKIQPIAANGKLYISTARGLYTFNASDGDLLWVYPTELPLGHSPTIATINGRSIAFVGGHDRRIHAIDANSGQEIPGYTSYKASAGFETNPLVVNNMVYAGNRDGYFYALDAVTGSLQWKYKTDGPILFSAAYKNGVVYFASNDAYAYALDASTGTLVWKSGKLPGQGFHSFWPVIYTNKSTGKDYVILTGAASYRMSELHLTDEETRALYANYPTTSSSPLLPMTNPPVAGDWVPGTVTLDASPILKYFEDYPHRRTVFVLDRSTGQEYTFTDPVTGKQTYAPFTWSGVTQSGGKYPPVINGIDGVYYQQTAYQDYHGWVSRGSAVGWKFGTPYISMVAQKNGAPNTNSSDEPMVYSSGGKLIYFAHCCDEDSGSFDISIPFGQPNRNWLYYGWGDDLGGTAPGYQIMYSSDPDGAWRVYGHDNGVYGKHGTTQSPPIPYQGRLYYLKGNALIAFGPSGGATKLPLATTIPTQMPATPLSPTEVQQRLELEIQKMLAAGHLRAGYNPAGFIDLYGEGRWTDEHEFGEIFDYFQNPSDTVVTLIQTLPYLSPEMQSQVKTYIQSNYGPGTEYDITRIAHIGYGTGAQREVFDTPPDAYFPANPYGIGAPHHSPLNPSERPNCGGDPANGYACGYWFWFPPFNFYAAWKYADLFKDPQNPTLLPRSIFNSMKDRIEAFPDSSSARYTFLSRRPYLIHLYIAGYQGYLELQNLAGYAEDTNVRNWYNQAMDLRMSTFSKDTPFREADMIAHNRTLSVARNFMFLTPEIADYMNVHLKTQVQQAIDEYNNVAPYWFVSKFDNSFGEGTFQHLYDYPALFQAKAYILDEPYDEVVKYLDVPAFSRGDLFYIQNLVAALTVAGNPLGFALKVNPVARSVDASGTASYTIQVQHSFDFTQTVTLEVGPNPFPADLAVDLASPTSFDPPGGETTLTLTDLHDPSFTDSLWYTLPISASGGDITRTASVQLFVNAKRVFLPVMLK